MDQNWVEFLAMSNRSQNATFALAHTLRDGLPLQVTIAVAGCCKKIEKTRFIRHEFPGGSTAGASNSRTI